MTDLMQQLDTSDALFICTGLGIILFSLLAGAWAYKMEIRENEKIIRAMRKPAIIDPIAIPAFQREARHPLDADVDAQKPKLVT